MTKSAVCSQDHPHQAAINDGPWQSFPSRAAAKAYVDRKVRPNTADGSWIRCSVCKPAVT